MSEKKKDLKNALIDLDLLEKIDALNERFFKTMENLKEARPCLQGCDEAFISVAQNLLSSYNLLYSLYYQKYRREIEYETALLKAKNEKTIPFYWRTKWLKKYRQNTAADLVDYESDEFAKEFFADRTAEIVAQYITGEPPRLEPNNSNEEWEIVGELKEDEEEPATTEEVQDASEGAEQAESGAESAPAEDSAKVKENAVKAAPTEEEGKETVSEEEPKKKRGRRKKEKKGGKEK